MHGGLLRDILEGDVGKISPPSFHPTRIPRVPYLISSKILEISNSLLFDFGQNS